MEEIVLCQPIKYKCIHNINKYYCKDCDKVFFCSTYLKKHIDGIVHKNKVIANESLRT